MIQIDQLTKYYDDFCAVDGIDLTIRKGEILGLLGPNGAGKTTTLRMLTGFFHPTSGTITVQDRPMEEEDLAVKQMIGYLPESAPLYHAMLVYDYLEYVAKIRGLTGSAKTTRIQELADLCSIGPIMHKPIANLSKGLKQRVGLAHAMMSDPDILILDEPTSGLDPNQIVEIREIIRRIGREKTIILSTHILSEAEATCDRIVIIHKGRIIADGTADAIKQAEGQERVLTVSLTNAPVADVKSTLSAIDGVAAVAHQPDSPTGETTFHLRATDNADIRVPVYGCIKQTDWELMAFHQESRSLEAIFRELTREN